MRSSVCLSRFVISTHFLHDRLVCPQLRRRQSPHADRHGRWRVDAVAGQGSGGGLSGHEVALHFDQRALPRFVTG